MRRHSKSGFTLVEALLTLFLFALTIVVVSKVVAGSQKMVRHSAGHSQSLKASQWALAEIRHKVEASSTFEITTTGSSDKLELTVLKPDLSHRLPDVIPNWRPGEDPWWDPYDPTFWESLEFRIEGDRLVRTADGLDLFLAENVESFKVGELTDQLQIELVIKEQVKTSKFVSRVRKP